MVNVLFKVLDFRCQFHHKYSMWLQQYTPSGARFCRGGGVLFKTTGQSRREMYIIISEGNTVLVFAKYVGYFQDTVYQHP